MEMLYDDTASKIKGSSLILQVARNPDNLTELAQNGKQLTNICLLNSYQKTYLFKPFKKPYSILFELMMNLYSIGFFCIHCLALFVFLSLFL